MEGNKIFSQRIFNRKSTGRLAHKISEQRIVNKRSAEHVVNKKTAETIINQKSVEGNATLGSTSTPMVVDIEGSMLIAEASAPPDDIITEIGLSMSQMEGNQVSASKDHPNPSIEDVITEEGVLCSILTNLTLREAAQTCVLSPTWRNIWTHVPKLYFGAQNMFDDHTKRLIYDTDTPLSKHEIVELMEKKTDQFISSVDSILQQRQLHSRSRVDEFVVRYCLHKIHSSHLDAWVSFAVSSKTKVLVLRLHKPMYLEYNNEKYDFPCHFLGPSSTVEVLLLVCCSLKPPCKFNGLNLLKKLELYLVDVTEEDINNLLSNCYFLEFIKLYALPQLVTLHIPYPLSQLQTFMVDICNQLRGEIKINAENLTNFVYYGCPIDFNFRQSSHLLAANVTFQTQVGEPDLNFYLNKLSTNLPQLQKLSCTIIGISKVPVSPEGSNRFIHLRHLDLCWEVAVTMMRLHHLTLLLDASPYLEVLNLHLSGICTIEKAPKRLEKLRETLPRHPHTHLKTVEFKCFYWDRCHVEFLLYLLQNAIELRLVKIMKRPDAATTKKLRQELPANVKLKI